MRMLPGVIFCSLFFFVSRLSCHGADEVLVMPFENLSPSPGIADKVTDIFARELVKTGSYRVFHPQLVRKYLRSRQEQYKESGSAAEAIAAAKFFGARYVLSGIITEYDSFPPFSLDISVEMFDVERKERVSADSIPRAGPRVWQWFAPVARQSTMGQYVAAACAQLIKRSFKKRDIIK
jgi:hypothetical protein